MLGPFEAFCNSSLQALLVPNDAECQFRDFAQQKGGCGRMAHAAFVHIRASNLPGKPGGRSTLTCRKWPGSETPNPTVGRDWSVGRPQRMQWQRLRLTGGAWGAAKLLELQDSIRLERTIATQHRESSKVTAGMNSSHAGAVLRRS